MKEFAWSEAKNEWLRLHRKISFEEIVDAIIGDGYLTTTENPSSRHVGQYIFVVRVRGYVWAVPFRESSREYRLLTAYPSRKLNDEYAKATPSAETIEV